MKITEYNAMLASPFGMLGIVSQGEILVRIDFLDKHSAAVPPKSEGNKQICMQLEAYFENPRFQFTISYELHGTPFQRAVWKLMQEIPCGTTRTYGDLAKVLHSAPRAVGQACGANPIPIIIPCHRVVSKAGIGGFANHASGYTISIKQWLLQHEVAGALI